MARRPSMSILGDRILAQRKISYVQLVEIPASDFDLAMTLDSGQVFHWEKAGAGFVGAIGDLAVYLEQQKDILKASGSALRLDGFKPSSFQRVVSHYFALDHQLAEICASFPDDPAMNAAKQFSRGLRIIHQPKWECLATFIFSSMNQVTPLPQFPRTLPNHFPDIL